MKKKVLKMLTSALSLTMLAALLVCPASAAGEIYVNDATSALPSPLSDAYAVGADENVAHVTSGKAYALTAAGLSQVGESSGDDDVPVTMTKVRVGLYYGSDALPEARLENKAGAGYRFGYYDADLTFHAVGATSETQLTMLPDASAAVGAYHIRLSQAYADFDAAKRAADGYSDGFPAFYNGKYYVQIGSYASQAEAQNALTAGGYSGTAYTGGDRCVTVLKTDTARILFEFDCGSTYSLAVAPQASSGKTVTWCGGNQYYGDFQYTRLTSGALTVVNILDLEDYVKGVVPYEVSGSWPLEAIKAQAVCARTYVVVNQNSYRAYGFDVTANTNSQSYKGVAGADANTDRAVDETAGTFVRYQGKLCSTLYFAADGGATENSENVFVSAVPYLIGVVDPYEADIDFYCKSWSRTLTSADAASRLSGYGFASVRSIQTQNTAVGNVYSVTVSGTDASGAAKTMVFSNQSSSKVPTFLSRMGFTYTSYHFSVSYDGAADAYTITGGGSGHNVGMSQWGAYSMAKVHGKTCEEIIAFYYTGAYVA